MIFSRHIYRLFSLLFLSIFIFLAFYSIPLQAQKIIQSTDPELRLKWYKEHVAMKEKSLFKHLPWQFIGPLNISGRCTDVAVVAPKGKYYTVYAAAASGGVWRTVNEGTTWEPVFQHGPSTSVGDVTLAPSDHKIVWIGLGEANIFRSSMAGAGVYKSMDEGETWKHMGLAGTHTIPRIVIHPENPDVVYVAASGHEWTDNKERGVFKTTDGGETWQHTLFVDENTGAFEIAMNPGNPRILFAGMWPLVIKTYGRESGGPNGGIWRSQDGGNTWQRLEGNGLPEPPIGKVGIAIAQTNPDKVYAVLETGYPNRGVLWGPATAEIIGR